MCAWWHHKSLQFSMIQQPNHTVLPNDRIFSGSCIWFLILFFRRVSFHLNILDYTASNQSWTGIYYVFQLIYTQCTLKLLFSFWRTLKLSIHTNRNLTVHWVYLIFRWLSTPDLFINFTFSYDSIIIKLGKNWVTSDTSSQLFKIPFEWIFIVLVLKTCNSSSSFWNKTFFTNCHTGGPIASDFFCVQRNF